MAIELGPQVLLTSLLIILARIGDVSLGTLRTISVIHGRRSIAWLLGFGEILVWLFAVSQVLHNLDQPLYAICYAIGFATGNYVGITLDEWLAFGEQVVRVFTRQGPVLAAALRAEGFRVTEFEGRGRSGPVHLLFIEVPRRHARRLVRRARDLDPRCFWVLDDVRYVSTTTPRPVQPTGWRAILKKK